MVGSILGVLFISLVRRVMVEDPELPFPESVAASEIHKAGQRGAQAAKYLFWNIGVGGVVYMLGKFGLFAADQDFPFTVGNLGHSQVRLGTLESTKVVATGGTSVFSAPSVSPAYLGVGYIIGLRLASIQFAGSVLAWGLLVPMMIYFLGPSLQHYIPAGTPQDWADTADAVWRYIVRPIAVGGMLVGAAYTLFKMRKSLTSGFGKALSDMRQSADQRAKLGRTERYMSFKTVLGLIALMFVLMCALYVQISGLLWPAILAAVVMLIVGFFFATVSGNLVGFIGSSNNPVSGLTLSTLLIAALLMVSLGVSGGKGVAIVLGVAAVVCVSSSVAGELLQDFKVGYILGGTPRNIQIAELIAVVVASLVMYWPLMLLHQGSINSGGVGFGGPDLPAPQAGLMATLAQGIVGGDMPWALVGVGILFGIAMIMMQVKSPMLVAVGMYLPFGTTFAIFVGGVFRSAGRLAGGPSRLQCSAKGSSGECRRPDRFGIDRRRSVTRVGLGGIAVCSPMEGAQPSAPTFQPSVLSRRRPDCAGWTRRPPHPASDYGCGRSQRTRAPDSHHVSMARVVAGDLARASWEKLGPAFLRDPLCPSWFTVFHVHRRKCCGRTPADLSRSPRCRTRSRRESRLMAVSKTFPAEQYSRGLRCGASNLRREPGAGILRQGGGRWPI